MFRNVWSHSQITLKRHWGGLMVEVTYRSCHFSVSQSSATYTVVLLVYFSNVVSHYLAMNSLTPSWNLFGNASVGTLVKNTGVAHKIVFYCGLSVQWRRQNQIMGGARQKFQMPFQDKQQCQKLRIIRSRSFRNCVALCTTVNIKKKTLLTCSSLWKLHWLVAIC